MGDYVHVPRPAAHYLGSETAGSRCPERDHAARCHSLREEPTSTHLNGRRSLGMKNWLTAMIIVTRNGVRSWGSDYRVVLLHGPRGSSPNRAHRPSSKEEAQQFLERCTRLSATGDDFQSPFGFSLGPPAWRLD